MEELLNRVYFNNTVQDYLIATGIILLSILLVRIFRNIVLSQLKKWATKTQTTIDDFLVKGIEKFGLPLLNILAIYIGLRYLEFAPRAESIISIAMNVILTYYAIRIITFTINHTLKGYLLKQEGGEEKIKQLGGVMIIISIVVWVVGIIFLLDNLGKDVTAIVAGLGVGGIAIALAAQTILGDLFNYFVIFFDRPFEIGDFIVVDDKMGTIEHIGIKTTRVKSLGGEQVVFSNSDLTGSRIHNFKRMQSRRILFSLGVTYQTPYEKLSAIPGIIRTVIENQKEKVRFDRAHFSSYGDFSLNFEVVYFVQTGDYNQYMDIQQEINLRIYEEFAHQGIEFAYPTQTVFLEKSVNGDQ